MRSSVFKSVFSPVFKPLFANKSPDSDKSISTVPESTVGDKPREHILLGGDVAPDTDETAAAETASRNGVGNNLKQLTIAGAQTALAEASVPSKPLVIDSGVRLGLLDLDANYVLGTAEKDNLHGTIAADKIYGFGGNDDIQAFHGDDTVYSGSGNDYVFAGLGRDVVHGGDGNDKLLGEGGDDVVFGDSGDDMLWGGEGNDQLHGGTGNDDLQGDEGNDYLWGWYGHDRLDGGQGDDEINGGADNDMLHGGAGEDVLLGNTGHDQLNGGYDDDVLDGGQGVDSLNGGTGNDLLDGGANDAQTPWGDYLTGGAGSDIFWFKMGESGGDTSLDVVWDFSHGNDQLAFVNGAGDTLFLGESNGFTDTPGAQAWYEHVSNEFGDVTLVHVRDGDGFASDIDVMLKGHFDLTIDDMAFG